MDQLGVCCVWGIRLIQIVIKLQRFLFEHYCSIINHYIGIILTTILSMWQCILKEVASFLGFAQHPCNLGKIHFWIKEVPPQGTLKWTKVQCQHLLNSNQQFNNNLGECDTVQLEIAMLGGFCTSSNGAYKTSESRLKKQGRYLNYKTA